MNKCNVKFLIECVKIDVLDKFQVVIEFQLDGCIIIVNQNFFNVMGYEFDEFVGQYYKIFMLYEEV